MKNAVIFTLLLFFLVGCKSTSSGIVTSKSEAEKKVFIQLQKTRRLLLKTPKIQQKRKQQKLQKLPKNQELQNLTMTIIFRMMTTPPIL
ncbi:hypothetical protein H9X57_13260 [Flavobacterium piscinae]|uniref:hypothetical protein n=1 Tax=Flavobacterium piscinae TaxID=2506424 RepID=UPI00198CDC68|nr:hypothetical protein [Flavobacterium piscinae]MBC8883966.1 hypothetical protein [Flavobacterium piscinae]